MLPGSDLLPRQSCLFVHLFARCWRLLFSAIPSATAIHKIPLLTRTLLLSFAFLLMGGPLRPESAYACSAPDTVKTGPIVSEIVTVPTGCDTVTVKAWGAGGGGGGKANGGVGGGGGFVQADISVTPDEDLTITIGGGGAGGTGQAGTPAAGTGGGTTTPTAGDRQWCEVARMVIVL